MEGEEKNGIPADLKDAFAIKHTETKEDGKTQVLDIVKEILKVILVTLGTFVWVLVVLLILSFVSVNVIPFRIEWMVAVSAIFGAVAGIFSLIHAIKKHR